MTEWPTSGVAFSHLLLAEFLTASLLNVTITNPTEAEVLASADFDVTWTFAPGTQSSFRVRIYEDGTDTVVYDSGTVASAVQTHGVPEGSLESGLQYDLEVEIATADANSGISSPRRNFSTAWAPSVAVTGLALTPQGERCAPSDPQLPRVLIEWSQVVPGGAEVFVRYSVWRRQAGTADWTRIASITTVSTVRLIDYAVSSYTTWEYAVTWTALDSGNTEVSNRQDPAAPTRLEFDWSFLHAIDDPSQFVMIPSYSIDVGDEQSRSFERAWNRQAPTAFIGEAQFAEISISGEPDLHRGEVWDGAHGLRTFERTDGSTLVLRIGVSGDRYFCATSGLARRGGRVQYSPDVQLTEVHLDEAVS